MSGGCRSSRASAGGGRCGRESGSSSSSDRLLKRRSSPASRAPSGPLSWDSRCVQRAGVAQPPSGSDRCTLSIRAIRAPSPSWRVRRPSMSSSTPSERLRGATIHAGRRARARRSPSCSRAGGGRGSLDPEHRVLREPLVHQLAHDQDPRDPHEHGTPGEQGEWGEPRAQPPSRAAARKAAIAS